MFEEFSEQKIRKENMAIVEKNSTCPRCTKKNVVDKIRRVRGEVSGDFFLGTGSIYGQTDTEAVSHCVSCGHEWIQEPAVWSGRVEKFHIPEFLRRHARNFTSLEVKRFLVKKFKEDILTDLFSQDYKWVKFSQISLAEYEKHLGCKKSGLDFGFALKMFLQNMCKNNYLAFGALMGIILLLIGVGSKVLYVPEIALIMGVIPIFPWIIWGAVLLFINTSAIGGIMGSDPLKPMLFAANFLLLPPAIGIAKQTKVIDQFMYAYEHTLESEKYSLRVIETRETVQVMDKATEEIVAGYTKEDNPIIYEWALKNR